MGLFAQEREIEKGGNQKWQILSDSALTARRGITFPSRFSADVFKEEFQMTEARFKAHVVSLASMSGISSDLIRFEADKEEGKLMARLDGILIIGNSVSNKVTVCFGSGHKAMAVI